MAAPATSVDADEVAFYERLADTWWDRHGPFWPLHRLNALRVRYLADAIGASTVVDRRTGGLTGIRVLDIGCGGGILSESLAALGCAVHGIDVVAKNIGVAATHARREGLDIRYETTTAEALAAAGHTYDVVLNMEVVEHVADLPGFMRACCALTRADGLMFVATLNRTATSFVAAIVGAEYVLRWLPRGTHRWDRFRTPREIEALLGANGMKVVDSTGVRVNPLTKAFSLTPSLAVNYMLTAHKPRSAEGTGR